MPGVPQTTATRPVRAWGENMFLAGVAGLIAAEVYFGSIAEVRAPIHLQLGLFILFLAALPALLWAKRGRASLPAFETLMLTGANTYAFPLLTGHQEMLTYIPEDVTTAAWAVITFQVVAILVYEFTPARVWNSPFWRDEVITQNLGRWLTRGIALNTGYVIISTFTDWVPFQFESVLRAIFFGIGIICTFITSRRLGSGELTPGEQIFFTANLFIQCIVTMSTLYLVGSVSLLLLTLLGYVSSSGKLPLVVAGLVLLTFAVLHNGKSEMRAKYWETDHVQPTVMELPAFFSEWIHAGLDFSNDPEKRSKMTKKLIERTSLFHIVCLVTSITPSAQPFMEGETYADIPAQFVPRFFWPEKPLGHVSTSKLSVYYGLQSEEDTLKTTIGFGLIAEGYANFGFYGVAGVAAFLAFFIKKVQGWAQESPLFSYGGLTVVILLAWSFQVEFTLSIWLASLYQACFAVLLLPFLLSRFIR